jgi:hypothetical protein
MRRHEQEITDRQAVEEILQKAVVCRIGLADDNTPYIVPVCFGYEDGSLYLHSSPHGHKIDIIQHNNNVCFEVDVDVEMIPAPEACKWSVKYRSVIGFGKASVIENEEEKIRALNIIMEHYSGRSAHEYSPHSLEKAAIIRIQIQSMTGKSSKQ